MSKTCETCKYYRMKRVDDYGICLVEPPALWRDKDISSEVRYFHTCAKWETKLERKCENCEYYRQDNDEQKLHKIGTCCRHPETISKNSGSFCGEFRGNS